MRDTITHYTVKGQPIKVWKSEDEEGYSISHGFGGWMIGSYDSIESALMGAELDLICNCEFYKLQKEVNYVDEQNRLLTVEDLKPLLTDASS